MELEVAYNLESEQQFWDELDEIISAKCQSHELIDNALRGYIGFTTRFKEDYLQSDYDIARCSYRLIQSDLFKAHTEYVRRQIIYGLLQEDDAPTLHVIAAFLLFDGKNNEHTLEMMQAEGVFPRLVELTQSQDVQDEPKLHKLLLELIYEMSRIQRLRWEDLTSIDDAFILYLFQVIEGASDDPHDPYHYPVIRVLLVLNEQYMVSSTTPQNPDVPSAPLTNRVIKALGTHGTSYKTFGCNLILLLNRETETSLQLLILKLLYLLFQNPATAEYFYTNDLYVLLDVILRNLLDLPIDSPPAVALRHTYLRVLHPLLANSQIKKPPHYKRTEVLRMLRLLMDSGTHFAPVDETTIRLVKRCISVSWLEPESEEIPSPIVPPEVRLPKPPPARHRNGATPPVLPAPRRSRGQKLHVKKTSNESASVSETSLVESPDDSDSKNVQKELARKMLGMNLQDGGASTTSMVEVAEHTEKPGVQTPSRTNRI